MKEEGEDTRDIRDIGDISVANLLSDNTETWLSSLSRLRPIILTQRNDVTPLTTNEALLKKLISFLSPSYDASLRVEASIVSGVMLSHSESFTLNTDENALLIVENLLDALVKSNDHSMTASLLAVLSGTITTGSSSERSYEIVQSLIDCGIIPKVISFLDSWNKETKEEKNLFKEAVGLICTICCDGSQQQVQLLMSENILRILYDILLNHHNILIEEDLGFETVVSIISRLMDPHSPIAGDSSFAKKYLLHHDDIEELIEKCSDLSPHHYQFLDSMIIADQF